MKMWYTSWIFAVSALTNIKHTPTSSARQLYSAGPPTTGRVVCYYNSPAVHRDPPMNYGVVDIPAEYCTHVIYGFVSVNTKTGTLKSLNPQFDFKKGLKKVVNLKKTHPNITVLLSVRDEKTPGVFSALLKEEKSRSTFVKSVIDWLVKYQFDGIDLYWDHLGKPDLGSDPNDKDEFIKLLQALKHETDSRKLMLTAAVPIDKSQLEKGYDVQSMGKILDQMHVMTYDLRGHWLPNTDVHSPLHSKPTDKQDVMLLNVKDGLEQLVNMGAPKDKLVVGIPFYGKTFILKDPQEHDVGAPADTTATPPAGPFSKIAGVLAYNEICQDLLKGTLQREFNDASKCPYAYHGNTWVGYEDETSIEEKVDFIVEKGYGGAVAWSVDFDDFRALCGSKNILIKTLKERMDHDVASMASASNTTTGETSSTRDTGQSTTHSPASTTPATDASGSHSSTTRDTTIPEDILTTHRTDWTHTTPASTTTTTATKTTHEPTSTTTKKTYEPTSTTTTTPSTTTTTTTSTTTTLAPTSIPFTPRTTPYTHHPPARTTYPITRPPLTTPMGEVPTSPSQESDKYKPLSVFSIISYGDPSEFFSNKVDPCSVLYMCTTFRFLPFCQKVIQRAENCTISTDTSDSLAPTTPSTSAQPTPFTAPTPDRKCVPDEYFPDPADCRLYHICTDAGTFTHLCITGTMFDTAWNRCRLSSLVNRPECQA